MLQARWSVSCYFSGKKGKENGGIYTCMKEQTTPTSSPERSRGHWERAARWLTAPHPRCSPAHRNDAALCRQRSGPICLKIHLKNEIFHPAKLWLVLLAGSARGSDQGQYFRIKAIQCCIYWYVGFFELTGLLAQNVTNIFQIHFEATELSSCTHNSIPRGKKSQIQTPDYTFTRTISNAVILIWKNSQRLAYYIIQLMF